MGELEPGTVFAGHRIDAVAGRGGMGVVYRATQLALDRTVALKVIAPGLLEDQTVRKRFVRESKVAASIDHPNVIPIYYAGEEDGIAYIAMRYVAGDDVRSLVRREGAAAGRARRADRRADRPALDAAHAAGLVHRDVKPANVLLDAPTDHVYLTDFGLTKHALSIAGDDEAGPLGRDARLRRARADPRRARRRARRRLRARLPALLRAHRRGAVQARGRRGARCGRTCPSRRRSRASSSPGCRPRSTPSIARALAKDPEERYPSAGDLGRAALAAAAGAHARTSASGSSPRAPPRRSSPRPSTAAAKPRSPTASTSV